MSAPLCVIVGAGGGVSGGVARAFAALGYRLALVARSIDDRAPLPAALAESGASVVTRAADSGNFADLGAALAALVADHGPAEVLVYNAAAVTPAVPSALAPAQLMADLAVSVGGALAAVHALLPGMRAAGKGTILLTGGGFALQPMAAMASLGVGKAGLRNLAFSLAEELQPAGIRVGTVTILGAVAPGTAFDPDRIAEVFVALHRDRAMTLGPERQFTGQ